MNKELQIIQEELDKYLEDKLNNNTIRDILYFHNGKNIINNIYSNNTIFDIIFMMRIDYLIENNIIDEKTKKELINNYYEYKTINKNKEQDKLKVLTNKLNIYNLLEPLNIKTIIEKEYTNIKIRKKEN